jgi:peptidoglycan L-alanyl-D-glutamate endopeptidase CwlK
MINSRHIDHLTSKSAELCRAFIMACAKQGIDILITSTYRDKESQTALYAQGRTKPGKKVTNARAGCSFHNYGVAFDFVPIVNGKAQWNDTGTFIKCGEIAEHLGLQWAGRWTGSLRELAHCQYTGGLTLADYQAGKKSTGV